MQKEKILYILFFVYEFIDENESGVFNSLNEDNRNYKNRITYKKEIIENLKEKIRVFKDEYKLVDIFNTSCRFHYISFALDLMKIYYN